MSSPRALVVAACTLAAATSSSLLAQTPDPHRQAGPPATAAVDFGILPVGPVGAAPCLQSGGIGGPADPCAYKLHALFPDEVTVRKGGEVTFQIHGGGHGLAIYEVDTRTSRDEVGQFLCPGFDPFTIQDPALHPCNLNAANANAEHIVKDPKDRVILVAAANNTNAYPENRVWYEPGRLMSAGGHQFLAGGNVPAGPTSNGQLLTYRFLAPGRYLVICMNRAHFLNDWMFGFVNVEGGAAPD
jgi:hypothetical protein